MPWGLIPPPPPKSVTLADEEAAAQMRAIASGDIEAQHSDADRLLCSLLAGLGYPRTVEAFNVMEKWYA